ncbi:MAG: TlpA disulfide reductase family protein [Flavobacteriales bacterium]
MRYFYLLVGLSAFFGCSLSGSRPTPGYYQLRFHTSNGSIPARLDITQEGNWNILNADELIVLDSITFTSDSFFVKLPLFDSSMRGTWRNDSLFGEWTDHSRSAYSIPFSGAINTSAGCENKTEEFRYDVTFSPGDSAETSKGVAVLLKHGNVVTGTILTETGDYRYLQGEWKDEDVWLSAFDGTHLFYLSGVVLGDSICTGLFLSGKHWKEPWVAVKSNATILRDPSAITTLRLTENPRFTVLDQTGTPATLDSSTWKNHVSVIQIMGSWCPNCTDESRFLSELYASYKTRGLQIIPVAFERGDDVVAACKRVATQFEQLEIAYPFYYGGKASKADAQKTLDFLTEVHSFPTSVFIDKKGTIRGVYTGFYGPGTHEEYSKHTAEITQLIDSMIRE